MAKQLDYPVFSTLTLPGTYWMIGAIRLSPFHHTCEIDFYAFLNEDARHQRLHPGEHKDHKPVEIRTIATTFVEYEKYIQEPAKLLIAAGYKWAGESPAQFSATPRGLKELFTEAKDV
jgi:hypothetical protein